MSHLIARQAVALALVVLLGCGDESSKSASDKPARPSKPTFKKLRRSIASNWRNSEQPI